MIVKRIQSGQYNISYKGKTFELIRQNVASEGESDCKHFHLYETTGGLYEYWQSYVLKRDAIKSLSDNL